MGLEQLKKLEDDAIQEIEYIYYYENKNIQSPITNKIHKYIYNLNIFLKIINKNPIKLIIKILN